MEQLDNVLKQISDFLAPINSTIDPHQGNKTCLLAKDEIIL